MLVWDELHLTGGVALRHIAGELAAQLHRPCGYSSQMLTVAMIEGVCSLYRRYLPELNFRSV